MRFSILFTLVASAAFVAAQTATVVVQNFNTITQLSRDLDNLTKGINLLTVLFRGPQVGYGLTQIGATVTQAVNDMDSPPPVFGNRDALSIVGVLKTFVSVHQALLNTIIGKHGILSLFFFAEPVRVGLVGLEAIVDNFALLLIDMIPTQAAAANVQFGNLDVTINLAIATYD